MIELVILFGVAGGLLCGLIMIIIDNIKEKTIKRVFMRIIRDINLFQKGNLIIQELKDLREELLK